MKTVLKNYSFNTSTKAITLTDISTVRLDRLALITDVTTNKILYNFADTSVSTATVATNVVTLSVLQGGENNTDKLRIDYDVDTADTAFGDSVDAVKLSTNSGVDIGKLTANQSVNTAQVGGTNTDTNSGNKSAGTQRIVLATDQPQLTNALKVDGSAVTQPVSGTITANIGTAGSLALDSTLTGGSQQVQGNIASGATDSGNPVKMGGRYNSTTPTLTDGQRGDAQLDTRGNMKVTIVRPNSTDQQGYKTSNSDGNGTDGSLVLLATTAVPQLFNGTNFDRMRSSGPTGTVATAGTFSEQASLTAGALNADLVASTDVSAYKAFALQITGTWSGTLTLQFSNDNSNWVSGTWWNSNDTASIASTTATGNSIKVGTIQARFMRVRMTSYTSGTATGTCEIYTTPFQMNANAVAAQQNGTWTVQPGNTANTTPWLTKTHDGTNSITVKAASTAAVAGDTSEVVALSPNSPLPTGSNVIGDINLSASARGGYSVSSQTNLTTTSTVSAGAGKFAGGMFINLNSAPAYIQIFDTTGAVTLGTTTPTFVIPIPANATAANGIGFVLPLEVGIAITNGIKIAATTTATGATTVSTGLTGFCLYK